MSHKPIGADTPLRFFDDPNAVHYFEKLKKRVELEGASVADLNQTIAGPSIAEVQAISDKVDELLASLRVAGVIGS